MQSASFPALARREAVAADVAVVYHHLRTVGVRFDARRKVREAADFSVNAQGSSLAFPSKLAGVSAFQTAAKRLASGDLGRTKYRRLVARIVPDDRKGRENQPRIALHVQGCRLGFVQDKHTAWLLPLIKTDERGTVAFCGVEFFALQVTGGTPDRPTRGVNFIITGLGDAARALHGPGGFGPEADDASAFEDAARRAAQEDAYASGSVEVVEATMD